MSPFVLILVFTLGAGSALAIDMPNNATCEGAAQFSKSQESIRPGRSKRGGRAGRWPSPCELVGGLQVAADGATRRLWCCCNLSTGNCDVTQA